MFMQMHGLLDAVPIWMLFVATLLIAVLSFEGGFQVGRLRLTEQDQEVVVRGLVGGMLGLLAFMLAFTFGVAATHFDARRQNLLNEANAIRTAYLRADLFPEPNRTEIRNLLREYVDVRLAGIYSGNVEQAIARSEELQDQLLSQVGALREKVPSPAFTSDFNPSLNEIITLHGRRVITGLEFRIPSFIWIVLFAIMSLASASIGYHSRLTGSKRPLVVLAFILAFSAVIVLIEDLDRPMNGFLEVSQRAMVDLQRKMNTGMP
jgi:hypothetical protein